MSIIVAYAQPRVNKEGESATMRTAYRFWLGSNERVVRLLAVACLLTACQGPSSTATEQATNTGNPNGSGATVSPVTVAGHFYYTYNDQIFRIAAQSGAVTENLSQALDSRYGASGALDRRINASANGDWMLFEGKRFGCDGCLIRVNKDLSAGEPVKPAGNEIFLEGLAAINATGDVVVYAASGGTGHNTYDLYKTTRSASGWGSPVLLTSGSTDAYNNMPSLSFDGARVSFDCGQQRDPESGNNAACQVGIDGADFAKLVTYQTVAGAGNKYVQNPRIGIDGVIFEAVWPIANLGKPEVVWLLPNGSNTPTPIGQHLESAVAPCPLRDGRFGVLWLAGTGNAAGRHEMAIVNRDGTHPVSLTPGVDVVDAGIGCSD